MRNRLLPVLLCTVLRAVTATAQEAPRVSINGFGDWSFGRTNVNNYLSGTPEGDYRRTSMSLNIGSRIDEKISIHAQGAINEDEDATHLHLSFAFADYHVSDRLSLRVGQVKHPFGIYTEVFAVGTLRPFLNLPQGFYGPVGFVGESYRGIGLTGAADLGRWAVAYDVYGGGNDLEKAASAEGYYAGGTLQSVDEEIEEQSTRDVIGGRLVFTAPLHGLSFGGSAYTGILNEPAANRRTVVAGQIGYRTDRLTLESEIAHENQVLDEQATGGYVLGAFRLTPGWEIAAQFNGLDNTFFGADTATAPSLQHHREVAVGLSRWLTRSLVLKWELHTVTGNRFAHPHPEDLVAIANAGRLRGTTRLFQFGAQFSF